MVSMKKAIFKTILSTLLILVFGTATFYAQNQKLATANKSFDKMEYLDAQKIYLAVVKKGYASEELFTKLAESYYFNAEYGEAVKWYSRLFEINPSPARSISKLRYSQSLKATGNTELAQSYFEAYRLDNNSAAELKPVTDYLALIEKNSGRYSLAAVKSLYDANKVSFGHSINNNRLIFASTSISKTLFSQRSGWDGLSYLSLYAIELDSTYQGAGESERLNAPLNSKFHQSSAVFSKDLNTVYFTSNNNTYANRKENKKLKIYKVQKIGNEWSNIKELSFNDDAYSSAHPALSLDEKTLYFASDRPGGFGDSDLYSVEIFADGSLGNPINLGPEINTAGKETFPFINANDGLYFSSNGHFGLGGLDVFFVQVKASGLGNLLNVGEPINSYADDFAFAITDRKGFVSSNRDKNGVSFVYDNIYTFVENKPIQDVYNTVIEGVVTDRDTGGLIQEATIVIKNSSDEVIVALQTNEKGRYKADVNRYETYTVMVSKKGYHSDDKFIESGLEKHKIDFKLNANQVKLTSGTDIAKVLNVSNIYFDYNKSDIRIDAQVELEKVIAVMEAYPKLRLSIRAHTDTRGNDKYNEDLSNRRAFSTKDYIVSKGIDGTRLTSEGFGERFPIKQCDNDYDCSEKEHQQNRRSEFIVLE